MHLIQEIGSYAGLAAIPGLAVLATLYFSQARDVRRLREWAGRAPERAAAGQTPAARPATAQPARPATAAKPATAAQPATAARAPAGGAAPAVGAATATAARPAPATAAGARAPLPRAPGVPGGPGAGQTAILGKVAAREPWYRRSTSGRLPSGGYLALIVIGVLVLCGGVAYALTQSGSSSSSGGGSGHAAQPKAKKLTPADVTVTVLNATRAPGLARTVSHKLTTAGFNRGNVNNLPGASRATSVVMFKPGANKAAGLVARKLHINSIKPIDASTSAQSGSAAVVVVVGRDRAPSTPAAGTTGGTGTPGVGAGGTATPGTATPGAGTGVGGTGATGTAGQ